MGKSQIPSVADLSRRSFLSAFGLGVTAAFAGCSGRGNPAPLDRFIQQQLDEMGIPGFAGAICVGERLVWSGGYGWADKARGIPMTADTPMNIASISKTVTAACVMQLWEAGKFQLDDDINDYLSFSVRNPRFPEVPVTFRHLLLHRSSIADGPAYEKTYACGDPAVSLADWIEGYFQTNGQYSDQEHNFLNIPPGEPDPPSGLRLYSNVGFGLLGYLVERVSDMPFFEYTRRYIFEPLGMTQTSWMLADQDTGSHAVPYSRIPDDFTRPADKDVASFLGAEDTPDSLLTGGSLFPHCLYSFYNYPDGLLRTSSTAYSKFLRAMINQGSFDGTQILGKPAWDEMLTAEHFDRRHCWGVSWLPDGRALITHSGEDPGVTTITGFRLEEEVGIVAFFNVDSTGEARSRIVGRMFTEGERLA